jgi:nitroreductase
MRIPLASHFTLPDEEMIYCGMALGYADETKAVNTLRADRASVDEFATFKGF